MMRKKISRKHATQRKGTHGRATSHGRRAASHGSASPMGGRLSDDEMGAYDPNRGEATS